MTMFCPDEERLSAWVDRGLTPVEDETISTHLAACEGCRRAVTIAFLVDRESPEALSDEGERRLLETVEGALAQPSKCATDEQLAAWLHDGLLPGDRAKVTDHLAECDDCRRTAALTRLSNSQPVSAMSDLQEARAVKVVLRSAGRDVIFSFWRVAAASLLVAIAATYVAIQWSGPSTVPAPLASVSPGGDDPRNAPTPADPGSGGQATLDSPKIAHEETKVDAPPEAPKSIPIPARFRPLPVYESDGFETPVTESLTYADLLHPKGVASINVGGRALVVLDEGSQARVAYAADAEAHVVEIIKGRVFIDTAGGEQSWEVRRPDRSVTLRSFRGRASAEAEAEGSGLRVHLLRGFAEVGPNRIEQYRAVNVLPDSLVAVEERRLASAELADRYAAIRPRTLLVVKAAAGSVSQEGPWRYESKSRKAQALEDASAIIPECVDPIRWVQISLAEPLSWTSDMVLRAACEGTGTRLYLWAGGASGWHREATRSAVGPAPEEWSLRGLSHDMVPIVAGDELKKIMIGVVQERGRERTLEVGVVEIRRVLD